MTRDTSPVGPCLSVHFTWFCLALALAISWLTLPCGLALAILFLRGNRGCSFRHFLVLLCLSTFRFWEAHPGPAVFTLGALNPTGLQSKHGVISQLPPGLYAASETHLTSRGVAEFNRGLHFAAYPHKLLPGAPARDQRLCWGLHGVGFITSAPARAACHAWHPDVYAAARLQVAHVFASPLWILSGVCCGYASGPSSHTHQRDLVSLQGISICWSLITRLSRIGATVDLLRFSSFGLRQQATQTGRIQKVDPPILNSNTPMV